jgi:hypothetical protein
MMLAVARDEGIDKDWHRIEVGDIQKYVDVDHVDRVIESLNRIAGTLVTYELKDTEFRKRGKFPLAIYEVTESLRNSTATLEYMIPPPVRRLVRESKSYALLEIRAFPRFTSKYTARLYPRLALRAGYDHQLRHPWTIDVKQLAEELGYPFRKWNYRHFRRDCLDRVLDDLLLYVHRFNVEIDEVKGRGRGRPVEKLSFRIGGLTKRLPEARSTKLTRTQAHSIRYPHSGLQSRELPTVPTMGRAVSLTGRPPEELDRMWREVVARAKAFDGKGGPDAYGAQDAWLLASLNREGADAAFGEWVRQLQKGSFAPPPPAPPMPAFHAKAPAPVAAPPIVPDEDDFAGLPASEPVIVDDPWDYIESLRGEGPDVLDDLAADAIPF